MLCFKPPEQDRAFSLILGSKKYVQKDGFEQISMEPNSSTFFRVGRQPSLLGGTVMYQALSGIALEI
jgi:hypothetical protein